MRVPNASKDSSRNAGWHHVGRDAHAVQTSIHSLLSAVRPLVNRSIAVRQPTAGSFALRCRPKRSQTFRFGGLQTKSRGFVGRTELRKQIVNSVMDGRVMVGSPAPYLHRDWAHPCHICTGTGNPCHLCAGTGLAPQHRTHTRARAHAHTHAHAHASGQSTLTLLCCATRTRTRTHVCMRR